MKEVYLNIICVNKSPMSIGMLSPSNEAFYGEFSEFNEDLPNGVECKMEDPLPGELEPWTWSNKNIVEMRGDVQDVCKNMKDWFQAILGGSLSWVDYSEKMGGPGYRNIKPVVDEKRIQIRTMTVEEWNMFRSMWDDDCIPLPECVVGSPQFLECLIQDVKDQLPDLDKFRLMYHNDSSIFDPVDNCRVLISYVSTAEKVKESQK